MIVDRRNDDDVDQFPVGMRVLAVDDDPICLRLLETLLRKCQYNVTTRDRAIDALELLRENKDKFDLVISDVHMPDMDGFKLLELVGLEMDLPVIMLSANGDTKLVMKGITHGACDYLVKPIRLEELKNIWQHVLRRKKSERKDQSNSDNREKRSCPVDEEQKGLRTGESDQGGKRRKDQDEDDDEDSDEDEDRDPSARKKARVVWSVELHQKFVAAVNQLGFERAVPKKILELMNVEKLTRENVASHLQKYRLYLKRLSNVANQQAHMVAALGGTDSAYLRMNSMNFHNFNASAQYQNNAFRSLPPSGVLGRLNSPAGLGIHALLPSGMTPLGHSQMTRNPMPDSTKFQLSRDQSGNILQGMPTSLEFDQLHIPPNPSNGPLPNGSLLLQGHSMGTVPFRPDSAFGLTDPNRSNRSWPNGPSTSYPPHEGYHQPNMLQAFNSSSNANPTALNGVGELQISSRFDAGCQNAALDNRNIQSNQNMGYAGKPLWGDHKLGNTHHQDSTNNSLKTSMAAPVGDPTGVIYGGNNDFGLSMNSSSAHLMTTGVSGMNSAANLGGFAANGAGSLEDVVTSVIKWEQDESALLMSSDLGGDAYPLRTCI